MKWKFMCAILSTLVLSSVCNLSYADDQASKHFVGGIALCEIGYGLGGFLWDESAEESSQFSSYLPAGIVSYDDDHWRKCGLGVLTFLTVGMITNQENSDMAWMFGGVFSDIVFKTAYRAWVHRE